MGTKGLDRRTDRQDVGDEVEIVPGVGDQGSDADRRGRPVLE